MIPRIIHYCWIGGTPLPPLAEQCIASWKEHMPEWQIMRWDETNFDIAAAPLYVRQAYEARKFAFVSDYVRLWALELFGGLYMDVDFMVFRSFDDLMDKYPAFAGYEGSKRQPVMQGVIASEAHGAWVTDMMRTYDARTFIKEDGSLDMTPNTTYFSDRLEAQGFVPDGLEKDFYIEENIENKGENIENIIEDSKPKTRSPQSIEIDSPSIDQQSAREQAPGQISAQSCAIVDSENQLSATYKKTDVPSSQKNVPLHSTSKNDKAEGKVFMLHVFPVQYFCPVLTTGEDVRTEETYCEHMGKSSWNTDKGWKARLMRLVGPKMKTRLIKMKRRIFG